jgi:hypothetical protein
VSARNIQCQASQDSQVRRSVVFSRPGEILVEDNVERPVQSILYAPMLAHDAKKFGRHVAARQQEVAFDLLVATTFAFDPRHPGEPRKVVLLGQIFGRRYHGSASFLAVVIGIGCGGLLGSIVLRFGNGSFGIPQQSRLIVFHGQHIVSATLDNGLRRIASAVQRIHGHDTAFELKHLDQFQGAGCFVVARRQNVGERQTGLCGPGCHHYRRHMALASFVGSPERFAVQGDYAVDFHRLGKGRREAPERLLQRLGVEHAEDTAEGVVARNTVLQYQNRAQKVFFRTAKYLDIRAVFGTTQRCQQRNEQHLRQVVIAVAPARVDDLRKVFCEASQYGLLANQETLSESIFLGRAIDWPKFHAIPFPHKGGGSRQSLRRVLSTHHRRAP